MPPTQTYRPFRLKTQLGDDALLLESYTGSERISAPFRFLLRVLSPDATIDMRGLLSKPGVISIKLDDDETERHIHGNFSRVKLLEWGDDGMAAYELEMVPWFWFMHHFFDSRIFQHKTAPQIIEQVFKDRGYTDYKLALQGSFPEREYCVQFRETDFNFISRLMEEEGILYYFEQSADKHTMVLTNANSSLAVCPHKAKAQFMPASGGHLNEDTVATIEEEFAVGTKKASVNDYDFEKPKTGLHATLSGGSAGEVGEWYDHPGKYTTKGDGDRYARIRLEEREAANLTVRGQGNCLGFECGFRFTLEEHFRPDVNQEYVLTSVEHWAQNTSYRSGDGTEYEYQNTFEAIPFSVPYRPPRLARKPVVHGNETALVVGKSGEEIWTDKYGRVIVQFYWDREGKRDEKSSCWIRVASGWAGKGWGMVNIPRIGQEVVVSFLDGDPDRPLIIGSVYNADQTVPYALPGEQAKCLLKSMSTKGGGGFNEIRMDDTKGSEQFFVHAEKDMHERVKDSRYTIVVDGSEHVIIGKDQLIKVKGDDHFHVMGDQNEKVGGTLSQQMGMDLQQKVGMNHAVDAGMEIHLKAGMNVVVEAGLSLTLKVGGNFVNIGPTGVTIVGTMVLINSGGAAGSGSGCSPTAPTDPTEAVNADPGAKTEVAPPENVTPASSSISHVGPAAAALMAAAQSGAPFCDT